MEWRDDIAAGLPSPSQDEPASLRQDILDELADHLSCAVHREHLRAAHEETPESGTDRPDDGAIQQRVLDRFGDPARIARQLWFDAIKEKLMLQKFATALAAAAAAAAIAACVMLWIAVDSGRRAVADAIEAQRLDREQNAKANAALLAKLESLAANANKPPRTMEWNPLKFQLLLGDKGAEPAVGYRVAVRGSLYGAKQMTGMEKRSNKSGIVDFGAVRPGEYEVNLRTPWHFSLNRHIVVSPGQDKVVTLRCPRERVVETRVKMQVELPKDLLDRNVSVMVELFNPLQSAGKTTWSGSSNWRQFLCDGRTPARAVNWNGEQSGFGSSPSTSRFAYGSTAEDVQTVGMPPPTWYTARYRIDQLDVLVRSDSPFSRRQRPVNIAGPAVDREARREKTTWAVLGQASFYDSNGYHGPTFQPQAGKDNVWTIKLPEQLLKQARERLRAFEEKNKSMLERRKKFAQLAAGTLPLTGTAFDKLEKAQKQDYIRIVRRYSSYLDTNNDHRLQKSEWSRSRRIKPIFEKAGIDLSKEMSEFDFVRHYIKLVGIDDPTWKSPRRKSSSLP